jgi:hypothetical protein
METTIKAISEYGVLIVIAGVFIWMVVTDRKASKQREEDTKKRDDKYNESLSLLSQSNENIAKSLDLLTRSMETNETLLRQHDERSIKMKEDIAEVRVLVSNCPKKK